MSDEQIIRANVPGAAYDIVIQPGLIRRAGRRLRQLSQSKKAAIVTDAHVAPLYLADLASSLRDAGFDVVEAVIPAGEEHKTIESICSMWDRLLSWGVERGTPVLALGGGVVGDMAGFAAATILRGVPFVQAPTSLLSMVDASVGGKTGIDHPVGKNLIGAFHQPIAVLIDPATLRTLPQRELRGGLAECIKHDIIRDAAGFDRLARDPARLAVDVEYLAELVAHNVTIKARVVEADPFEKGERAHLNFGHTFAHAIETVSKYQYSHGEAVALGMIAASRTAQKLGMIGEESVARISAVIAAAGLPVGGMKLDTERLLSCMLFDKKVKAGKVRFILPDRIGHVVIRDDVPADVIRAAFESLGG